MKESTGELNMTVITVVAIAAIAGLFYTFIWPMIKKSIVQNTCDTMGYGYQAIRALRGGNYVECDVAERDSIGNETWMCCPPGFKPNREPVTDPY